MLTKGIVEAVKKSIGASSLVVPIGNQKASVKIGELCELALRQIRRQPPLTRKFRYVDAGEITVFQKQTVIKTFPHIGQTSARLVWVVDKDVAEMGEEVRAPEGK